MIGLSKVSKAKSIPASQIYLKRLMKRSIEYGYKRRRAVGSLVEPNAVIRTMIETVTTFVKPTDGTAAF